MNRPNFLLHLDLNLLLVFEALLEEQSVTRAGSRLGLSQTAVSHGLGRLRTTFQDDLFVKRSQGMLPTSMALGLAPGFIEALNKIRAALDSLEFDPLKDERIFKIAMTDYFSSIALPRIVSELALRAPRSKLRLFPNTLANIPDALELQEIDLAIGVMSNVTRTLPDTLNVVTLLDDDFSCVMRPGHPSAGQLELEQYMASDHLLLSLNGEDSGIVDAVIKNTGHRRMIALTVTHYLAAPEVILSSDLIMTVSSRMANLYCQRFGLIKRPLPVEMPPVPTQLVWASRFEKQSALIWMRNLVIEACRTL